MNPTIRSAAALGWAVPLLLAAAPVQEVVQDLPANVEAPNAAVPVEVAPEPEPKPANETPAPERAPIRERVAENVAAPEMEEPAAPTPAPIPPESAANVAAPAELAPAPAPVTVPAEERSFWLWVLVALGALGAVFAGSRLLRWRSVVRPVPAVPKPVGQPAPEPVPAPAPEPEQPVVAEPRARIDVAFRPARAGLNLLSATAEGVFTIVNRGDRPATGLRFGALLLPAYADLDSELVELWAGGVTRPVVAPFALAPGEEREVRHTLSLPRAAIEPLMTGGRPMFVPVVAVSAVYDRGDSEEGQAGRAWILGVAREGADRLAPLWLDEPPRNRDDMAARLHAARVDR